MAGDDEGFLARWSRRKHDAETTTPESTDEAARLKRPDQAQALEPPDVAEIIARLPPIDEITAATDIRAFLAPGVPTELRVAALRRAWRADPAIRDFIGLAENQWDFNAPDGVPGFASMIDPDEVRRLLAKVVGGGEPEPDHREPKIAAAPEAVTLPAVEEPLAPAIDEPDAPSQSASDEAPASPRHHGGALPR
ncbi:MAG: DUF3306 domain-containing protein [Xanthobacteraceae bacterium]|nr:DUF3306 domain-containing protein [Xanthobacteraceae bacterium]